MSKNLIIIGARAMGRETCNYARDCGFNVKGFLDSDANILNGFEGYPSVIAPVERYTLAEDDVFICAVGDPCVKERYVKCLQSKGAKFVSVIHPTAYVGPSVAIGDGTIICANATLTCDIKIGRHVIVNVNSSVSHDSAIGDFSSISPGCSIAGRVALGKRVFLGVGAKLLPDVSLGDDVVVGAGAVVTKSWNEGVLIGVPAGLKSREMGNMVDGVISISCASDEAYYCGLVVTLHSLVSHAKEGSRLVCHVLDTGLTEKSKTDLVNRLSLIPERSVKVVFHPLDASQFEGLPEWRGSRTAYGRLLLHDILKDEDYTIYTDVDTLWLRDVSELWAMRAEVPVLAAVPDGSGMRELSSGEERSREFSKLGKNVRPEHYYCSGLLLMNLKELRNRDFTTSWRDFFGKYGSMIKFPDQDVYNWFFQPPEVLLLDFRWGEFSSVYGARGLLEPRVMHYAKQAPWNHKITVVGMLWWRYVRQNLKRSRFSYAANWRCFLFSLLRIPFVFNIVYAIPFLINKKAYMKRKNTIDMVF